ncbi:hypothetical protein CDG60_09965 [Acinetobacter chinensis]|uniref:Uncharacterized protein n=1 Tax=Acinetobacter chinensis TaxID=2004650 RepID=A0A3B7M2J5_9GAMM|nr:hypothetical protein [Acinetobacter chinensis]AXY56853.1 hypothetical protein CDG60_09965 [Acinetobacter chinensis]
MRVRVKRTDRKTKEISVGYVQYVYDEEWVSCGQGYISLAKKGYWVSDYGAKVIDPSVSDFFDSARPGQEYVHSLFVLEILH